ncbi:hypothetical protein HK105_202325 [Polyrhizophydium stewartii]|uniref:Uncharacterized protein n=1 Tax=Polyrhizophydium stewartii TaxID=2732419 RepID=A0ABR4NEH1_9FUNG
MPAPTSQLLGNKGPIHTFYKEHLKDRLEPLRAGLADHAGLSEMISPITTMLPTNLRNLSRAVLEPRIKGLVQFEVDVAENKIPYELW